MSTMSQRRRPTELGDEAGPAHVRRRSGATRSSSRPAGCSPSAGTRPARTRSRAPRASRSPTSCGSSAPSASCSSRRTARRAPRSSRRSARSRPARTPGTPMGDAYVGLLADRDLLRLVMHGFIAGADDEVGRVARHTLGEAFRLFRERSGADEDAARAFVAQGMLINVLLAVDAPGAPRRGRRPGRARAVRAGRHRRAAHRVTRRHGRREGRVGPPPRTVSSSSTSPPAGPATTSSRACAGWRAPARSGTRARSTRWRPASSWSASAARRGCSRTSSAPTRSTRRPSGSASRRPPTTPRGRPLAVRDASGVTPDDVVGGRRGAHRRRSSRCPARSPRSRSTASARTPGCGPARTSSSPRARSPSSRFDVHDVRRR